MNTILCFIELSEDKKFAEYEKYIKYLSPEKQVQIQKFRFDLDKKLGLLSDLFVRYIACESLNQKNEDLIFKKNYFGKPYLFGFPDFNYNISHTKNAFIVGFSEKSLGVDIEKNKSVDLIIAEQFFNKNEIDYILSGKSGQEKLFYQIWTRKEAYIKKSGKGLATPLSSFDVTDAEIDKLIRTFELNGYIISICCEMGFCDENVVAMDEEQIAKILADFNFKAV